MVFFFLLQACAVSNLRTVVDPVAIYKEGLQEGKKELIEQVERGLGQKGAYGHTQPYHPVRLPADIRKVWVVDHPNEAGDLVSGHWAFIVVRAERWASPSFPFVQREVAEGERMPLNIPLIEEGAAAPPAGQQGVR